MRYLAALLYISIALAGAKAGAQSPQDLVCLIFPPLCNQGAPAEESPPPYNPPPLSKAKELADSAVAAAQAAVKDATAAIGAFGGNTQLETAKAATASAASAFSASQKAVEGGLVDISTYVANAASLCLQGLTTLLTNKEQSKAADIITQAEAYANEAARISNNPQLAPISYADAFAMASVTVHTACGDCTATAVAHAFAISMGGTASASAYAAASCTVRCVDASQSAFESGAYSAAGAGAALAASLASFASLSLQQPDSALQRLQGMTSSATAVASASAAALQSAEPPEYSSSETATLAASLAGVNTTAYSGALIAAQETSQPPAELEKLQQNVVEARAVADATVQTATVHGANSDVLQMATQAVAVASSSISIIKDNGDVKSLLPKLTESATAISVAFAQVRIAIPPALAPLPLHPPEPASGPAPGPSHDSYTPRFAAYQGVPPPPALLQSLDKTSATSQPLHPSKQPPPFGPPPPPGPPASGTSSDGPPSLSYGSPSSSTPPPPVLRALPSSLQGVAGVSLNSPPPLTPGLNGHTPPPPLPVVQIQNTYTPPAPSPPSLGPSTNGASPPVQQATEQPPPPQQKTAHTPRGPPSFDIAPNNFGPLLDGSDVASLTPYASAASPEDATPPASSLTGATKSDALPLPLGHQPSAYPPPQQIEKSSHAGKSHPPPIQPTENSTPPLAKTISSAAKPTSSAEEESSSLPDSSPAGKMGGSNGALPPQSQRDGENGSTKPAASSSPPSLSVSSTPLSQPASKPSAVPSEVEIENASQPPHRKLSPFSPPPSKTAAPAPGPEPSDD